MEGPACYACIQGHEWAGIDGIGKQGRSGPVGGADRSGQAGPDAGK